MAQWGDEPDGDHQIWRPPPRRPPLPARVRGQLVLAVVLLAMAAAVLLAAAGFAIAAGFAGAS